MIAVDCYDSFFFDILIFLGFPHHQTNQNLYKYSTNKLLRENNEHVCLPFFHKNKRPVGKNQRLR